MHFNFAFQLCISKYRPGQPRKRRFPVDPGRWLALRLDL